MEKALVIQGGGTRGIYAAGVLDAFMISKIRFDYVVGTSAGALAGANYVSGDAYRFKFIVVELMNNPRFISFRNRIFKGTMFDFDYLFHEVPKEISPFNEKKFFQSKTMFYSCATKMEDGLPIYFEKGDLKDPYLGLAASSSLPLLARPVDVEGTFCLDGGVTSSVPFYKPLEDNIEKIVVIGTRPKGYRKQELKTLQKTIAKSLYKQYPKFLNAFLKSKKVYNKQMDELDRLEEEGRVFIIRPKTNPEVGVSCKDKQMLLDLYRQGYYDALEALEDLKIYMGN
mgnify:FL=1